MFVKYPGVSFVVGNLRRGYSESYLIFRDRIFPFILINRFLLEKVIQFQMNYNFILIYYWKL